MKKRIVVETINRKSNIKVFEDLEQAKDYVYRIFLKNDLVNSINYGYDIYANNLKQALEKLGCSKNRVLNYYKFSHYDC